MIGDGGGTCWRELHSRLSLTLSFCLPLREPQNSVRVPNPTFHGSPHFFQSPAVCMAMAIRVTPTVTPTLHYEEAVCLYNVPISMLIWFSRHAQDTGYFPTGLPCLRGALQAGCQSNISVGRRTGTRSC